MVMLALSFISVFPPWHPGHRNTRWQKVQRLSARELQSNLSRFHSRQADIYARDWESIRGGGKGVLLSVDKSTVLEIDSAI